MSAPTFAGRILQYIPEGPRRKFVGALNRFHPLNLVLLYSQSILTKYGWFKSRARGAPVNKNGEEIPWMTYSSINFLDERLAGTRLFEYGGGNSTVWYADRASKVVSVEDDEKWYRKIKPLMPENASLHHISAETYANSIQSRGPFDVIIIDGLDRNQCIEAAVPELSDSGIIILDDAQRQKYKTGKQKLRDEGFSHIEFEGLKPINRMPAKTSVYYRENNCLGL
ncbi:class I SAM-dependent methyltransferase [Natrinema sp. CBA1119]|uniref:class I SAM-dependent methyltransferase n=1 Tax=Natrinema sp. CBA1119 TaxID=1608465 RepID=UPI001146094E|nr:class I SAM-dependent methyltransferase [Natrinema sp. CBA1119]